MVLPPGVSRIVLGPGSATRGDGCADVSLLLVVVVPVDAGALFCMVFAMSSTGEFVAEPAPGDPVNRCRHTEEVRLVGP